MAISCGVCNELFEPPYVRSKYCSLKCRKQQKSDAFIAQRKKRTELIGATHCMVCTGCAKPIIAKGKCYDCAVSTKAIPTNHVIQPASWRFLDVDAKGFRQYHWLKLGAK